MNTSTSLQVLAALAVGGSLLASATPADAARGGFRPAAAQVSRNVGRAPARVASFSRAPTPTLTRVSRPTIQPQAHRSNARSLLGNLGNAIGNEVKTVGGDIVSGKIQNIPGDVLKTGSKVAGTVISTGVKIIAPPPPTLPAPVVKPVKVTGHPAATTAPVFGSSGTTGTGATGSATGNPPAPGSSAGSTTTTSHPVTPPCDFNCAKTSITPTGQIVVAHPGPVRPVGFPMRPPAGGRGGFATSAPTMSPGPATIQPAMAPVVTQPSARAPVQPSCLRQAITPDGQVVTFDICTNQAVVTAPTQVQTQPQQQTQ